MERSPIAQCIAWAAPLSLPSSSSASTAKTTTLRRPRYPPLNRRNALIPSLCAHISDEAPASSSPAQFGLLTDSVLELKWKNERSVTTTTGSSSKQMAAAGKAGVTAFSKCKLPSIESDQLLESDPYKAFAHFTRLAAPTAALGDDNVAFLPQSADGLQLIQRDSPYSAASIAHRLMRYSYAKKNLAHFIDWFQGEFDNYHQIREERKVGMLAGEGGGHEHIHCSIRQISDELLFARYYFNGNPNIMFRSRLYHVSVCDHSDRGLIEMRIFRFYEEIEQQLKANNYDIHAIEWTDDDVYDWMEGCEVYWEKYIPKDNDSVGELLGIEPGCRFVGYMKGGGCEFYSRDIGGLIRVMDDLLLTSEDLWVADRGFDQHDRFVYGNRRGVPYKMRRVKPGDDIEWTVHAHLSPPDDYIS